MIDDLTVRVKKILKHGEEIFDEDAPSAFKHALDYTSEGGFIATLPELIAARAKKGSKHWLWQESFLTHSEEHALIDNEREFVMVVHGGGLFTPERFQQSYEQGIDDSQLYVSQEEITNLLQGKLPTGKNFPVYSVEEITKGISTLPHHFGVIMPYAKAQESSDRLLSKGEFVNNLLVIARAGGPEHLETYYEKTERHTKKGISNRHDYHNEKLYAPTGNLLYASGLDNVNNDLAVIHWGDVFTIPDRTIAVKDTMPKTKK